MCLFRENCFLQLPTQRGRHAGGCVLEIDCPAGWLTESWDPVGAKEGKSRRQNTKGLPPPFLGYHACLLT